MPTPPQEEDPELRPLEADESVPPRPEEEVADAAAELYTQPGQPYPPSPEPQDVGAEAPSADMADPGYQPPDYPQEVEETDPLT